MKSSSFVYILTNSGNTTFYIGVTSDFSQRMYQHKHKLISGFTSKYNLIKLVYFEEYPNVIDAIIREKQLKNWHRDWKINLIHTTNPNFRELDPETSSG